MTKPLAPKDPDAVVDYQVDWWPWLDDDTIASSVWIIPDGIAKDSDTYADKTTTVWLSGGADGQSYELVNRITTAGGRTEDRTITINVKQK